MLMIRAEQMAALSASMRTNFERDMADHLSEFFPEQCAALGVLGLSSFIRTKIDLARRYGIERERDVCKFLGVAMAAGGELERSGKYPQFCEILEDESLGGEQKVRRLVELALESEHGGNAAR